MEGKTDVRKSDDDYDNGGIQLKTKGMRNRREMTDYIKKRELEKAQSYNRDAEEEHVEHGEHDDQEEHVVDGAAIAAENEEEQWTIHT